MILELSITFVNKQDTLYENARFIKELEGYETVICHGSVDSALIYNNEGEEIVLSAEMLATLLCNTPSYNGGNIRLVSCSTGANSNGFAQSLANELQVNVMAPSESIWIGSDGQMFISDNEVLAHLWEEGENVNETGEWIVFKPEKGECV